jgi:hypothetical protein
MGLSLLICARAGQCGSVGAGKAWNKEPTDGLDP